jgi:hypothetical protein
MVREEVRQMGTTDVLSRSVQHTHEGLAERFDAARAVATMVAPPRQAYGRIDGFLAITCMHLHATDAVLLRPARRRITGGETMVHDYVRAVKTLEVVLAHVKANEYGSVYERAFGSPVWSYVDAAMTAQQHREKALCNWLTETLDDDELDRLTKRLRDAQLAAPTRPHPNSAHTGLLGLATRKVMHTVDRVRDNLEGRMISEPVRASKRPPRRVS